jgi:hypothetical protein
MHNRIILLAGVIGAVGIAACGGSGSSVTGQGTTATGNSSPFALSKCMRTHGVSNFPDPTFPAGGGTAIRGGPGVDPQSPAFQHAQAACGRF